MVIEADNKANEAGKATASNVAIVANDKANEAGKVIAANTTHKADETAKADKVNETNVVDKAS